MSTPQVILVDDDQQMRSSTSQALELAGVAVRTVASGVEALALAGPGFDGIVVSDIRMPQMDGMTLMARLRELDPDLPVILITGHADVQLAISAIRAGAYDFFGKTLSGSGPSDGHPPCLRPSRAGSGQPSTTGSGGQA